MPWLSASQRRWGHTEEGEEALGGPGKVAEWDSAGKGEKVPEKVVDRHLNRTLKKPKGA
jgi:hypothetical protein